MSDTSNKANMPSTSPIDTILPKNNNSNQDNKSIFLESSQDTNNSDESKGAARPKTVTINLDRNKLKAGANSGQDADDQYGNTTGESQPLLGRSNFGWSFCEKLWLIIFIIMVAVGVFIGVFLLMWLGYENTHYHLIVKNKWTTIYPTQEMIKLKLPVHNVSLVELNASDTSVCGGKYYYASCVKLIQTQHINQLKEPDILYNFIVDQDGTIYEGRGWENCTCSGDFNNEELTIGVLVNDGSVGRKVPLYLKNFLQKSEDKLNPCFTITLINGTTLNPVVQRIQEVIRNDKC